MFFGRRAEDRRNVPQSDAAKIGQREVAYGLRAVFKRAGSIIAILVRVRIGPDANPVKHNQNSSFQCTHGFTFICSNEGYTGNGSPISGNA